jgi:hypothetical protein
LHLSNRLAAIVVGVPLVVLVVLWLSPALRIHVPSVTVIGVLIATASDFYYIRNIFGAFIVGAAVLCLSAFLIDNILGL